MTSAPPTRRRSPGERQRRIQRRRLSIVVALTVLSTLAIVAIGSLRSQLFAVDEVMVSGAERASSQSIIEASAITVGSALIDVDPSGAARRVEQVPWVGTAEVRSSWRGGVEIAVQERRSVATMTTGDRFVLVDDWGRQLEVVPSPPEGQLVIAGLEASGEPGQLAPPETASLLTVIGALKPPLSEAVVAVGFVDDEIVIDLGSGGVAHLGDGREIDLKLQALATVLERVDLRCLAVVDVSVPSAPTIRRHGDGIDDGNNGSTTNEQQEPLAVSSDC